MKKICSFVAVIAFAAIFFASSAYAEFNWSGFHVGVTTGNVHASADPQSPSGVKTLQSESLIFGPRVGYDHQIGGVVIGALADFVFTDLSGSVPDGNFIRFGGETDWVASIRGRLGVPIFEDKVLPYVTGGLAFANSKASMSCPSGAKFGFCSVAGQFRDEQKEKMFGHTLGAGVEFAITDRITAFTEYRFTDFGNRTVRFKTPLGVLPPGKTAISMDQIFAGLTFRF